MEQKGQTGLLVENAPWHKVSRFHVAERPRCRLFGLRARSYFGLGRVASFTYQHPFQSLDDPLRRPAIPFWRNPDIFPPPVINCDSDITEETTVLSLPCKIFIRLQLERFPTGWYTQARELFE